MARKRKSRPVERKAPKGAGRRTVRLAIIGLGTVGTGTVRVLQEHEHEIERRLGCRLELKTICDLLAKDVSWFGRPVRITRNWREVIEDPEIDIVVELIGGVTVARVTGRVSYARRLMFSRCRGEMLSDVMLPP